MGAKYASKSATGYNSSPPADDGSQTAANLVKWSTIKTKLADPGKTLADDINTALVAAFDYSVRSITSSDNTVAGDHMRMVEIASTVTTAVTVSLGDAATMTTAYRTYIKNSSAISQTVGRVTVGDTIDGVAANVTLAAGTGALFEVNAAGNGYTSIGLKVSSSSALASSTTTVNVSAATAPTAGQALVATGSTTATWQARDNSINDFRLTLTTAVPVTTTDVTGATTVYCTPYKGNRIALYDGSAWNLRTTAEFSLALGTLTSGKPYDVFCYDNAGVPTLEFLVWTSDTARATALVYQDGVLSKTGALTRRYLGTFYTTSTTQTEDSAAKRLLWNYYNRVDRQMIKSETTASWTYTTNTYRQVNNSTANQLEFICGVAEDVVSVTAVHQGAGSSATPTSKYFALGVDAITRAATTYGQTEQYITNWGGVAGGDMAFMYCNLSSTFLGRHYVAGLEKSDATGTTTWSGNTGSNAGFVMQGRMTA